MNPFLPNRTKPNPGRRSPYRWLPLGVTLLLSAIALIVWRQSPEGADVTPLDGGYFMGPLGATNTLQIFLQIQGTNVSGQGALGNRPEFASLTGSLSQGDNLRFALEAGGRGPEGTQGVFTGTRTVSPVQWEGQWQASSPTPPRLVKLHRVAAAMQLQHQSGLALGRWGGTKRFEAILPVFDRADAFHQDINRALHASCNDAAQTFTSDSLSHVGESLRGPSRGAWNWLAQRSFQILHDSTDLVSLLEINYSYTGGAHGLHGDRALNYWHTHARATEFNLADLFQAHSDWESRLSKFCLRDLQRQNASSILDHSIQKFKASDLNVFTVSTAGVQVYFAPYTVGSYAEGTFVVLIPWSVVRSCLRRDGPAHFVAAAIP